MSLTKEQMSDLRQAYKLESLLLEDLFGLIGEKEWQRLNLIHRETELFWYRNYLSLENATIKYVLISEAPPWTQDGNINYIYNPNTPISVFLREIAKTFLGTGYFNMTQQMILDGLCKHGFLLFDSIPFAMNYSQGSKRRRNSYDLLVKATSETYLQRKLTIPKMKFSRNVKVAFSVKKNADAISRYFNDKLPLGSSGITRAISRNIAVNDANYPCADRLRQIYEL